MNIGTKTENGGATAAGRLSADEFNELVQQVETNASDITALETTVTSHASDITSVKAKNTTQDSNISTLTTIANNLTTDVGKLKSGKMDTSAVVQSLGTGSDTVPSVGLVTAELGKDRERLTALESKDTVQDDSITAVKAKNTEQDGRLDTAEADISALETGKMDTSKVAQQLGKDESLVPSQNLLTEELAADRARLTTLESGKMDKDRIVGLTEAEYDAIETKDADTVYLITEE